MPSLTEKTTPLGYANALHLLRRATFNPSKAAVNSFASMTPAQALDQLFTFGSDPYTKPIDKTTGLQYFPDFNNQSITYDATLDSNNSIDIIYYWLYNCVKCPTIQWKLTVFLHSIFIADYNSVSRSYDYIQLLSQYTNKSLKELAYKMTLNPQMLSYLSNNSNTKNAPNQNYAREFLELFTIMKGPQQGPGDYTNYTELDVQQAARVLSGFRAVYGQNNRMSNLDKGMTPNVAGAIPNPTNAGWTYATTNIPTGLCTLSLHDTNNKTFSTSAFGGQTITGSNALTGAYTVYDELQSFINMIFNKPATAKNYARRIYRFFVNSKITNDIENDIITPMANHLMNTQNGITYNLESVVKLLLKSKHFYDEEDSVAGDQHFGAKIKSPLDLMANFLNESGVTLPNPITSPVACSGVFQNIRARIWSSGMMFFSPVDVNGYPGYSDAPNYDKNWVTIATLNQRYTNGWYDMFLNGLTINSVQTIWDTPEFVRSSGYFTNPTNVPLFLEQCFDIFFCSNPQGLRYGYFENALLGGLSAANWATTYTTWTSDPTNSTKKNAVRFILNRFFRAIIKSVEYQVM